MDETVVRVYLRFILYYYYTTQWQHVCMTEQVIEKGPFNHNNDAYVVDWGKIYILSLGGAVISNMYRVLFKRK